MFQWFQTRKEIAGHAVRPQCEEKTRTVRGEGEHAHALRVESRPSSAGEPRKRDIHIDIKGISGR